MKLEDPVCSLELAQKLKLLGVKQESLFYWKLIHSVNEGSFYNEVSMYKTAHIGGIGFDLLCSAFTVAELGEMLPYVFGVKKTKHTHEYFLQCEKLALGWHIFYENGGKTLYAVTGHTEANARASMLVYLLENGLVTL